MKKLIIFSICVTVFAMSSDAASPGQRRGSAAVSTASSDVGTSTVSARAATRSSVKSSPTSSNSGIRTTSARSATPVTKTTSAAPTVSARAASKQKVVSGGTKITTASKNILVDEMCQQQFEGCMDAFCMLENDNGGRCVCSDRKSELDEILAEIEKLDAQSYKMATEGVERLEMGADADAVIAAANKAVSDLESEEETPQRRSLDLSMWDSDSFEIDVEDDIFGEVKEDITDKTGNDLYLAGLEICAARIPACSKDMDMLKLMYGQNIKSDCSAYENELKKRKSSSAGKLAVAERALRDTALESYRAANKYDLGQCTIAFKTCMQDTAGCGDDFTGCVGIAAADNAASSVGSKKSAKQYSIKGKYTKISIAASTMDAMLAKKTICENVTNSCVKVKDQVWDSFLANIAPTLKSAELLAESNLRTNCISNISTCFQKACKDTIDPNDPDGSYDMCLSRPETVRSLCKVQIDPCESAEPEIMNYVYARLEAMRTDACKDEAKACFTADNACGENFENCIGLDFDSIKKMCSFEKLIACQKDEDVNSIDDLDDFLYGLYLSVDDSMLTQCQNLVNEKMIELCGGNENCDAAFADDKFIGTESLTSYQNNDGDYVVSGLVSFGNIKVSKTTSTDDDVKFGTYEIDINDYKSHLNSGTSALSSRVVGTLQSVANKIDQKIAILTSDAKIGMCVNGRDVTQVTGRGSAATTGRYPNLLASSILAVINSGLEKANDNYGEKYNELVTEATESQNDDVKGAMCAAMAADKKICVEYDSDGICSKYKTNDSFENLFSDTGMKGLSGQDMYSMEYIISGAKMSDMIKAASTGTSEYTQVDPDGNMLGRVSTTAVYSPETNTCNITTITTMCDEMDTIITTNKTKGGSMFSKSSKTVENFQGVMCTSFKDPTTNTSSIEM